MQITRFNTLLLWFLLISFLASAFSCGYAVEHCLDDREVFQFATHLYEQKEYYRAISEYQRLEYYFPDSPLLKPARLQIGRAYMAGNRIDDAVRFWRLQLGKSNAEDEDYARLRILLGISLLDLDRARTFSLRRANIQLAFDQLSDVNGGGREVRLISDFVDDWTQRPEPVQKHPWLAGAMSAVVPGSGSAYTGRYLEGTYTFFITGLFYLATLDALRHGEDGPALVFGFFSLAFYGGNIYTAVNSAYKVNDKMEADELLRLRKKHGIWFIPKTDEQEGRF